MKILETNKEWLCLTYIVSLWAFFFHFWGQTSGSFQWHDFFSAPNFYAIFWWWDKFSHLFTAIAISMIIQNFNLPHKFKFKPLFTFIIAGVLFTEWEHMEYILADSLGWMEISFWDTMVDIKNNICGVVIGMYAYEKVVLKGVD